MIPSVKHSCWQAFRVILLVPEGINKASIHLSETPCETKIYRFAFLLPPFCTSEVASSGSVVEIV
jgi:hypothetical protein